MLAPRTYEQRVDDAVATFFDHNINPFVRDYLKIQRPKVPLATPRRILEDLVPAVLKGTYDGKHEYHFHLTELERYLDRLQEHGCQHVFLFRLPSEGRDELLAELRQPQEIERRLGDRAHLYNAERLDVPDTKEPELVEVVHREDSLFLEWVETRKWMKVVKKTVDPKTGKKTVVRAPQRERTANFFYLDLDAGAAELRLQKLHTKAMKERLKLRERYRALVTEAVGIELPEPLVLAPAIRQALIEGEIDLRHLDTVLPDGGKWSGGRNDRCPVDVRDLRAATELKLAWQQTVGGTVLVSLDGKTDEVQILGPCVPEEHQAVRDQVRRWHRRGIGEAEPPPPPPPPKPPGIADADRGADDREEEEKKKPERPWSRLKRVSGQAKELRRRRSGDHEDTRIDRAIREYVDSHDPSSEQYSHRQFLSHIDEVARCDERDYAKQCSCLEEDGRWLARWSYLSTGAALVLILTGAYLIFFTDGNLEVGTLGKLIGLISGGGTVHLRITGKTLRERRKEIEAQRREERAISRSIRLALAIPDREKRTLEMERIVDELLARVGS